MTRRERLDVELVRRGLARSREQAGDLVAAGRVRVAGSPAVKPATRVAVDAPLIVTEDASGPDYVSRGGHKLAGALDAFEPDGLVVTDRMCLDAGASTGGFTDVLLRRGARHVFAVDVGYGQLAWRLRTDERVSTVERTNVRTLTPAQLGENRVDLVVGDLSFISLRLVLPALSGCTRDDGDLLLMVKPQFEVGRELLGAGGVVRDPALRARTVIDVADAAASLGLGVRGVVASSLPGPAGNVEYFLWLASGAPAVDEPAVHRAVSEGPQ